MEGLSNYWYEIFPRVWGRALQRALTCNGKYRMEQLELVPRWAEEHGKVIMTRRFVFRKPNELFSYCKLKCPRTLQMGGVFPGLFPELEVEANDGMVRKADRELHKAGVISLKSPFVIDVDVDDYDRTGVCACPKSAMCVVCWEHCMHSARLIIDFLLRNVLMLRRVMHFWSGRRGIHIWCFDERAFEWTKQERQNIMAILRHRELCVHLLPEELKALPWPKFDMAVSVDPSHCTGVPMAPHHATGAIRIMLPPLAYDKEKFDPQVYLRRAHMSHYKTLFDLDKFLEQMNRIMDE